MRVEKVEIRALSLWEPWATLMRLGEKTVETRSWPTAYRGPLLICASKRRDLRELRDDLRHPAFRRVLVREGETLSACLERLHFGKAVAIVDLVECIPTEDALRLGHVDREASFGDYSSGRWAWRTTNLRAIEPFPIRGHQGLWIESVDAALLGAEGVRA